ncbi:MAG TPA: PQQ-binding-like beta-propeller repeat protein [Terriglobales bacterium]|nr:PQQ-binding-like beta-propeller repeat protein [Terriglobales bacterium]
MQAKRALRPHIQAAILAALVVAGMGAAPQPSPQGRDWTQFGWNLSGTSAPTVPTGITAATVGRLNRKQAALDGTVDASPIYLHAVSVKGAAHDVFFVTTTYGKTIAVDADTGGILWEFTPPGYATLAGTRQITNSTPVADPDRRYIYAASPDGKIEKLAVSDGHLVWSTPITLLPLREKMDSPLRFDRGHVIAVTAGYIGDRPPYQGHVAILDAASGKLEHVWNSLCSGKTGLMQPSTCPESDSAIWGRAGAVLDGQGNIFVATGNAKWDGKTNWGDALIELNPDATQMLANYTPANTGDLDDEDLDLGSTSPVLLAPGIVAQGGKDKIIRLLSEQDIQGTTPHQGHELQTVPTPSGQDLFTQPAVWHNQGQTWLFAADNGATEAFQYENGKLVSKWKNTNGGTSPVVAGGLLYVYNPKGGLMVYQPGSGQQVADLECGAGHWNSPIVMDGRIALPEGNANRRQTSGVLDIWSGR